MTSHPRAPSSARKSLRAARMAFGASACIAGALATTAHLVQSNAFADSPSASTNAKTSIADAKAHLDVGYELFVQKKYEEAAAEFRTAFSIRPYPPFLFNEAVCYEKMGRYDDAANMFRYYIDKYPSAQDRQSVLERIKRIERRGAPLPDAGAPVDAAITDTDDATASASSDALASETSVVAPVTSASTPSPVAPEEVLQSVFIADSLPTGAPLQIWSPSPAAHEFKMGGENPGWTQIATGTTPFNIALTAGSYHVVFPKFRDYRAVENDLTITQKTGTVLMVDLAQGAFYGVLKIRTFEGATPVDDMRVSIREPGQTQFDPRDTTPSDQVLKEGKYTVRIDKKGFETIDRDVDIVHGELTNLRIDVARSDVSESWVYVQGADRAKVVVDDREVGIWTPGNPVRIETKAGKHKLVVRADDRKTFENEVDFPRGRATSMHVDMKPGVSRTAAWVNGILAVGFLGGGSFLGFESNQFRQQLQNAKNAGTLNQADPRIQEGQYFAIFADVSFGLAAVLGVISFYQFLADPTPPSTATMSKPTDIDEAGKPVASLNPSWQISPWVAPKVGGLSLSIRF